MTKIQVMTKYALLLVGTPYKYGGNNPLSGLDCSGLICELLKSVGLVPHRLDLSAQGIYDYFSRTGTKADDEGSLVFFGKSLNEISHIGYSIGEGLMVEAGGGDHLTLTLDDAKVKNAFVKIRPIRYRTDYLCGIKP